jgi:cyclic pyranopterin phosphate synthase
MDVGESNGWDIADVVPASELLASIESRWSLERLAPNHRGEVATRWAYSDGAGEIGVIHSVSQPFCGGCTRARLSADGTLYTCLFADRGADLRTLLRSGAGDAELVQSLAEVWEGRSDRYSELRALRHAREEQRTEPHAQRIEMSYIGG